MARHYSTKDFFRQMPNTLLARYFEKQGYTLRLGFKGGLSPEPLFNPLEERYFARRLGLALASEKTEPSCPVWPLSHTHESCQEATCR
jgi:hypothetical protein